MNSVSTVSFDVLYSELFSTEQIAFGQVNLSNPDDEFFLQQPQMSLAIDLISGFQGLDFYEQNKRG